jgi:putative flippase GtrA
MLMSSVANRHRIDLVLVRYSISGLLNGAVYAGAFLLAVHLLSFPSYGASAVGYVASLAVGFLLHRNYTFLVGGAWKWQMVKYIVAQAFVMSVVAGVSHTASNVLQWTTSAVIGSGIAVAPVLTFTLLHCWVFPAKGD